jgi:hypothetical protein
MKDVIDSLQNEIIGQQVGHFDGGRESRNMSQTRVAPDTHIQTV